MANTISSAIVSYSCREVTYYFTLASDGSEETGLVVYDSSVVATQLAAITPGFTDPLTSRILEVYASVSAAGAVAAGAGARVKLLWDANTDVLALDIPSATNATKGNFRRIGGLLNKGSTGITGDILLTTTGLESGDAITIVLTVGAY